MTKLLKFTRTTFYVGGNELLSTVELLPIIQVASHGAFDVTTRIYSSSATSTEREVCEGWQARVARATCAAPAAGGRARSARAAPSQINRGLRTQWTHPAAARRKEL